MEVVLGNGYANGWLYDRMNRLNRLLARWIPVPHVLHPYPMQRFDATTPKREPYA